MRDERYYRRLHIVQTVVGLTFGIAVLFIIGTAGSLELDKISLGQATVRFLIGLTVGFPLFKLTLYLYELEETNRAMDEETLARKRARERRRALR